MDKEKDIENTFNHGISVSERKSIVVTGVKKIESFDNEEFLLETSAGPLGIKGKDLEIIKLDTYEGTIMIKGVVDAFSYFDTGKSKKENSIITKLFK